MFWKKSAKAIDSRSSGVFSLGAAAVSSDQTNGGRSAVEVGDGAALGGSSGMRAPVNVDLVQSHQGAVGARGGIGGESQSWSLLPGEGAKSELSNQPKASFIIPKGYKVSSTTFVAGIIRVDGELSGRSVSASEVVVSSGGELSAPFEGESLVNFGVVSAPVEVSGVADLRASSVVEAPLRAGQLLVERGARILKSKLTVGGAR